MRSQILLRQASSVLFAENGKPEDLGLHCCLKLPDRSKTEEPRPDHALRELVRAFNIYSDFGNGHASLNSDSISYIRIQIDLNI